MQDAGQVELLKNPAVIQAIHQHLWVQSEKAGHDVGLAWAAEDWMTHYAQTWISAHAPSVKDPVQVLFNTMSLAERHFRQILGDLPVKSDSSKKRSAKSYFG